MTNQGNTEKNMSDETELDSNTNENDANEEVENTKSAEVKPGRGRPRKDPSEPAKKRPIIWVGSQDLVKNNADFIEELRKKLNDAEIDKLVEILETKNETIISTPEAQLETEDSAKEMFLTLTGKECHEVKGPFLECRTLSKSLGGETASSKSKTSKGIDLVKFIQENKLTGEGCKAEIGIWSNVSVFYTTSELVCLALYDDAVCNPGDGKKKRTPPVGLQPTLIVNLKNQTEKVVLSEVKAA